MRSVHVRGHPTDKWFHVSRPSANEMAPRQHPLPTGAIFLYPSKKGFGDGDGARLLPNRTMSPQAFPSEAEIFVTVSGMRSLLLVSPPL